LQTKVEKLIEEYEKNLQDAANCYAKIMKLLKALNNDYSLKITTRLTSSTINFKNRIDQSVVD